MSSFLVTTTIFLVLALGAGLAAAQNECLPTRCNDRGPQVRFPFWLKGRQPESCGYPGFGLTCNRNNDTALDLQFPVRASAENIVFPLQVTVLLQDIDYRSQVIRVLTVNNDSCLPKQLSDVKSFALVFSLVSQYDSGSTLFNCSSNGRSRNLPSLACLSGQGFQVYVISSYYGVSEMPLSSCFKMYNISYVPNSIIYGPLEYSPDYINLNWTTPFCGKCEAAGKYCRLNSTNGGTECFDIPKEPEDGRDARRKALIAGLVVGIFVLLLVLSAIYRIFSLKQRKKSYQKRIEQFLEDYKALRPTRYTYADIKKFTNGFKDKLGKGGYGMVFKGQLSNEILVAVKVLDNLKGNGEDFINEVGTIGRIHHVNVVRLIGYCADGFRRALVYEFLPNDSLEKYISLGNQSRTLGWEKLQEIAVGIAKGLDYLHQGCNQRIVHFDIKPHNILLDHNFNPKVADFGLAKLCSKEQSIVTMTAARGTIGYIAPEVFSRNFGNVSYKSDIYSFGMLLLDMVGGRKNFQAEAKDSASQIYFPEWMYNQLEKGEDIAIQIETEDDSNIFKKLVIVGLWCIQWYPADRPSMKVVIQMLEGENIPIMPPNPFASSTPLNTSSSSHGSISNSEVASFSE